MAVHGGGGGGGGRGGRRLGPFALHLWSFLSLLLFTHVQSFYLPGVAPQDFNKVCFLFLDQIRVTSVFFFPFFFWLLSPLLDRAAFSFFLLLYYLFLSDLWLFCCMRMILLFYLLRSVGWLFAYWNWFGK